MSDKTIDDGGPAMPHAPYSTDARNWSDGSSGMSLRDWFAGQALAGLAADGLTYEGMAKDAYELADAMLAAREPKP